MRKSSLYHLLLIVLFPCWNQDVQAQLKTRITDISIRKITHDEGLSQIVNLFRYEDSQGFMWITANDALNRFDGKNVKVYNLKRYFNDCPVLQQGYGFAEDEHGNLYVGSYRGLYVYHRKKDMFTLQKIYDGEDQTAMPIGYVDGKVYCFNRKWQITSYDVENHRIHNLIQLNVTTIPTLHQYAASQGFTYIFPFIDKKKNIWIINKDTICTYNLPSHELIKPLQTYSTTSSFKIASWYYDSMSNQVLISTNKGLLTYKIETKEWKLIQSIANTSLLNLWRCVEYKNIMAFYSSNYMLKLVDLETNEVIWEDEKPTKYTGDRNYSFDQSGCLWMSHPREGQIILDMHPKLLQAVPSQVTLQYNKTIGGTACLAEMPNGDIIGNMGSVIQFPNKRIHPEPIVYNKFRSHRKVGDLYRNGVWCFTNYSNANSKNSLVFINQFNLVELTIHNNAENLLKIINDVQVLSKDYLLLALEKGVYVMNTQTKQIYELDIPAKYNAFKFNLLSRSRIAVSYLNGDMSVYEIRKDDSLVFLQNILQDVQSYYIAEDSLREQYWVGSNQGVYLLDSRFQVKNKFDVNIGLAANNIYGLLLDDAGNAWCSHTSGISHIDVTSGGIKNFNKEDGIQDWDFNNRSFVKGRDGTLYFGGVSGINFFKPPLEKKTYYKSIVTLEDIWVNNKVAFADTNANYINQLTLKSFQNSLVFNVFINDLSGANHAEIIYRLLPNDTVWQKMSNPGKINFNSLASGDYELELGIYDNFSNQYESQKRIRFSIAPKFYQTWWFFALCLMILAALVYWYIKQRERKLQAQHKAKLEVDILIAETELRALRAQMNPHFVFNCLNSILECIETKHVDKASIYLIKFSKLLRKILHASESSSIGIEEEVDILTLYLEMEILRFGESFHYEILLDDTLQDEDIRIPSLLVQPFVENAIWHGLLHKKGDKKVVVTFAKYDMQHVKCIIEDNGIGRSNSKALKEKNLKSEEHQSKGISLSENRLSLLGQLQNIQTELNIIDLYDEHRNASGTRVEILIPIY